MAYGEQPLEDLRSPTTADRNRAWRTLYDTHFDMVYRLICKFGTPQADVEDLAQRVFTIAHRRIEEGEAIENVGGWLRGVVIRCVQEHRRWRRVRTVKHWLLGSTAEASQEPPRNPERAAESSQAQTIVGEVLERMSPKLRAVLVLTDMEELSPQEASEILGIPLNTVRSRRRLAREQFKAYHAERERKLRDG